MVRQPWTAWDLDWLTILWVLWIAQFVVLEFVALRWHPGQELTAHLRPLFLEHPLTWWLTFGAWVWLGLHFLAPKLEQALLYLLRP